MVILILGILVAIAIPMLLNQRKAAREATLKSDLKNIATLIEGSATSSGYSMVNPAMLSEGNSVTFVPTLNSRDGFCLSGINADDPENVLYLSSITGGMTDSVASCMLAGEEGGDTPVASTCSPDVDTYFKALVNQQKVSYDRDGLFLMVLLENGLPPASASSYPSYPITQAAQQNYDAAMNTVMGDSALLDEAMNRLSDPEVDALMNVGYSTVSESQHEARTGFTYNTSSAASSSFRDESAVLERVNANNAAWDALYAEACS